MRERTLVIGLDGFSFLVADQLVARGELPNLARLIAEGARGDLESTLMPNSFPGWTSCATGCNEGKHGIFMPLVRRADNFSMKAMDATDVRMRTVWELLGERGRSAVVVNDPCSYPPQRIANGYVVAGMTTPDASAEWTHPIELKTELLERVPDYVVDVNLYGKSRAEILGELERAADARLRAAEYLMESRDWDLFWVTFTESDRVQHRFWADSQTDHPSHTSEFPTAIDDMYRRLDGAVGALVDRAPAGTRVFIVSDHGFGPFYCFFNLTGWLIDNGYTVQTSGRAGVKRALARFGMLDYASALHRSLKRRFRPAARHGVTKLNDDAESANSGAAYAGIDWSKTRAYATLDGGVRINLRGREPNGVVSESDAAALAREIQAKLRRETFPNGEDVFEKVLLADEAFSGSAAARGPDVVMPVRWSAYKGSIKNHPYLSNNHRNSGEHGRYGVFVAWGPGVEAGARIDGARLMDVAPTVLYSLGEAPTVEMDGRVLSDAFTSAARAERPPIEPRGSSAKDPATYDAALTLDEEALVEERLRGLGYIE